MQLGNVHTDRSPRSLLYPFNSSKRKKDVHKLVCTTKKSSHLTHRRCLTQLQLWAEIQVVNYPAVLLFSFNRIFEIAPLVGSTNYLYGCVRPIAVGSTSRRLPSKLGMRKITCHLITRIKPHKPVLTLRAVCAPHTLLCNSQGRR